MDLILSQLPVRQILVVVNFELFPLPLFVTTLQFISTSLRFSSVVGSLCWFIGFPFNTTRVHLVPRSPFRFLLFLVWFSVRSASCFVSSTFSTLSSLDTAVQVEGRGMNDRETGKKERKKRIANVGLKDEGGKTVMGVREGGRLG